MKQHIDPREKKDMSFLEDVAEGMDRMMDEGGGVVDETLTFETPVQRNNLVDVDQSEQNEQSYE
ncbi:MULTISPECIES: hypothetical protein [Aneurinibacillus]|uniref:Uncharacterized protein n=1 Tax=Aneurinibacillus thermoaerophilus TaxID=143495 RepID=A0A1G8CF17_ANETH|nr:MULTISPECIES: hypothetical protein [Aneurinibacillus]AMA71886.1 hypothetical protein ACH33_02880 [Aneurinibacillus sp. XH2]MED0674165.1 hypothetical protein [Aneurinibacillus thermoaerophilus]MED0680436.1 hypothetical protein [Aneurinibacillus thermoaerophilus]MED0737307.1 hypothetical protein [Aneurinibacillus thermoaerophilus]MED0758636.1 hypothetical protein [Aneurinibacillus thermoaerophilus]